MGKKFVIEHSSKIRRLPPYLFGTINAIKYKKRRDNIDIIDLGMGNPTDPAFQPVVDKLCDAVREPRSHRYSVSIGLHNLRREVARNYARKWHVELDPEKEIVAVIGSKEGFSHLCLGLLESGDTALVPSPTFPIHVYAVVLANANVISVPLAGKGTLIDRIAHITENIYPKPKVLILNFPHNPTTMTVELPFFEEVVKFCRRNNIIVIHDFAYGETTFDGYRAPSFLQVKGAKEIGVEFTTMSKAYNMAGWRIGFCAGNPQILETLAKIKGYYDYGIFQPIQVAAIIALRECGKLADSQAKVYERRRDVLCRGLERIGWDVTPPRATMFAWLPIPREFKRMGSIKFTMMLLEEANVAVAPGRGFGEDGEGFLRFALVENEQRLKQAVRQIDRALRKKKSKTSGTA
jgi:alanine-synthesizing transaminase